MWAILRCLLLTAAAGAVSTQRLHAPTIYGDNQEQHAQDLEIVLRGPSLPGGLCQADSTHMMRQAGSRVAATQTEADRVEMIRQAVNGLPLQLRTAIVEGKPRNTITGNLDPPIPPDLTWSNRTHPRKSDVAYLHPDDDEIVDWGSKHRGKTFLQVYVQDRGYLQWCVKDVTKTSTPKMRKFLNYAQSVLESKPARRRLDKAEKLPSQEQDRHVPLAFISERPLQDREVFVVEMEACGLPRQDRYEGAEASEMLHKFVKRMWWKVRRQMKHSFVTARLTRSPDSNADFEVLFSSPPSHADVALIERDDCDNVTESRVARRVRNVTTTITANDDWPEYKELMIQAYYRGIVQEMSINQNHVRYSESGLILFNATVRSNIAVRDRGSCTITRYVKVSLSRIAISEKYHLLAGFEVKHFFEANPLHMQSSMKPDQFQNVYNMKRKGKNVSAGSFRSLGMGPRSSGALSRATGNFTIAEGRRELSGKSLMEHNNMYPGRRTALKNAPNSTLAVGLRTKTGKILNFPPQILEPVWRMEDLPRSEISRLKLQPGQWWDYVLVAANYLQRALSGFPNQESFVKLNMTEFKPSFKRVPEPKLKRGGCAVPVQILPVFPPGVSQNHSFVKVKQQLQRQFDSLDFRSCVVTWLDPLVYDSKADRSLEQDKEDLGRRMLQAIPSDKPESRGRPVLLIFLPKQNTGKFTRQVLKQLASDNGLRSQCVQSFTSDAYKAKELAISILAKVGSQWKICPGLAGNGTYFLALDVSRLEISQAGSCLVSSNGTVFPHVARQSPQKGEKIKTRDIIELIRRNIDRVELEGGEPVRHLVVCRDGRFQDGEGKGIEEFARERNYKLSLVEVTKSGPTVFRMVKLVTPFGRNMEQIVKKPEPGVWWKLDENTANLCTTGTSGGDLTSRPGLPQPIAVRKVAGGSKDVALEQIVQWMYWLARLKAYSDHSTRLPIHLHLADRLAKDHMDDIGYPDGRGIHAA